MLSAVSSSQLIGITFVLYLSDNCTANSLASGEDELAQFNKMINDYKQFYDGFIKKSEELAKKINDDLESLIYD